MVKRDIVDIFEALEIVSGYSRRSFSELVALKDAVGRYASGDIYSPSDYPLWRRSRMDGFACNSGVSDFDRPFTVCGDISAADVYEEELGPNECIRIATGARVPESADAVIRLEDSNMNAGILYLNKFAGGSDYIEKAGSAVKSNQLLIKEGSKIDHRHIETLATLRINNVYVKGAPRIGILSTGSEITDQFYSKDYILNSNYYALSSLLNIYGVPHSSLGVCADDRDMLESTIASGIDNFDAMISFGGTAFSRYDLMETVIKNLGGDIIIDGLNSSPGKTFRFGMVSGKPFFVLPGTPQAAMVCSELFLTAWLSAGLGRKMEPVESEAAFPVRKRAGFYKLSTCFTKVENGRLISYERESTPDTAGAFRSVLAIPCGLTEAERGGVYKTFINYYL